MTKLYPSRWPIVLAGMNGGSDKNLALAVAEAGGFPSIFVAPASNGVKLLPNSPLATRGIDFDFMYYELLDFIKCKGDSNVSVPIAPKYLFYPQFLKMAKALKISHWDIFPRWEGDQVCCGDLIQDDMIFQGVRYLRRFSHVVGRLLRPSSSPRLSAYSILAVTGIGTGGACGTLPIKEFFEQQIAVTPNTIPHGGIGTPQQVKEYIQAGAPAVAVGTLFAACVESPLSKEAKQRMVEAEEVTLINAEHQKAKVQQNALIFDQDSVNHSGDDSNHNGALYAGIHGNGNQGLIMAGHAVRHIDRVRTVQETMDYLVSELENPSDAERKLL